VATARPARPPRADKAPGPDIPVALPLLLDGAGVGALLITRLVPQVGRIGRLQDDLLQLLSERIAPSLCLAALGAGIGGAAVPWAGVRGTVPAISLSPGGSSSGSGIGGSGTGPAGEARS